MVQAAEQAFRSGFVAVVGRPNVGKSTLMNALIGKRIAITSSRPETTRKAIRGIYTTDNAQIVLVDTPGIHRPRTLLGKRLNDAVEDSLSEIDAVAFLLPADQEIGPGDRHILSRLRTDFARAVSKRRDGKQAQPEQQALNQDAHSVHAAQDTHVAQNAGDSADAGWRIPIIAIVTKIDAVSRTQLVDKLNEINAFANFSAIVPVSALEHDNVAEVASVLIEHMPEGPQMYPAEQVSEESEEDLIAEMIRGAFLEKLNDELPHSLAVVVNGIEYPQSSSDIQTQNAQNIHDAQLHDTPSHAAHGARSAHHDVVIAPLAADGRIHVLVSIFVERDSQKPIIIGKNAEHLVWVKRKLRTRLRALLGAPTVLDMHVKVAKNWQSDPKLLERLGF